jgi:RNA polymerase sigma factor (sigma-70 family)
LALATKKKVQQKASDGADWFELTFSQNWNRVYGIAFALVGDHAEAEDLALETFWKLYNKPPANITRERLGGWLYRVVTNLGLNALRSQQRRKSYEQEALQVARAEHAAQNPSDQVERIQTRQNVRSVLAQLKSRSAKLLILRYSGFSYRDIAVSLKIAPGSVGPLLVRAEQEFEERYKNFEKAHDVQ